MVMKTIKDIKRSKDEKREQGKEVIEVKKEYISIDTPEPIDLICSDSLRFKTHLILIKPMNKFEVDILKRIKYFTGGKSKDGYAAPGLKIPIEAFDEFVNMLISFRDNLTPEVKKQIKIATGHPVTRGILRRQANEIKKQNRRSFSFLD